MDEPDTPAPEQSERKRPELLGRLSDFDSSDIPPGGKVLGVRVEDRRAPEAAQRPPQTFSEVSPDKVPSWAQKVVENLKEGLRRNVETP